MSLTTPKANRFVYGRLAADAQLAAIVGTRIYNQRVPAEAPEPYVVFGQQSGTVLKVVGGQTVWGDLLYLVKVVDYNTSPSALAEPAADRVDAALDVQRGAVSGGQVYSCVRVQEIQYTEPPKPGADIPWWHVGALYRVRAA